MPLDFSIPGRALANLPNPAANYAQALSLKDMMQQAQLRDTQLADATEQRQQRMTLRDLTAKAIRPDGSVDSDALRAAYAQTGDIQGLTAYNASEAQAAEAQRRARAAEIETNMKQVGYIAQLVGNVRDPETWALALQQAKATGLDTSQFEGIPYSPQLVEQIKGAALTTAQQLEQEWKARDYGLNVARFDEQRRANRTSEGLRAQSNQIARARESNAGGGGPGGKLPPGYRWNPQIGSAEPIPGTPQSQAAGKASIALQGQIEKAQGILDTIKTAKNLVGVGTAGFGSGMLANIRGSGAADLETQLDTIRANLSFAELKAMREASPTGGALGSVTERELGLLQSTLASLDTRQSPAQLRANLAKIERHYNNWLNAVTGKRPVPGSPGRRNNAAKSADPLGLFN